MSLFTSNPFGYLLKIRRSDELTNRQSSISMSSDANRISNLQVRMMIWELEAYMDGDHLIEDSTMKSDGDCIDHGQRDDDKGVTNSSNFKTFTDLLAPKKKSSFWKENYAKRLKLEDLCGELNQENSQKVIAELRECVLRANPPLKPDKVAELFELILGEKLENQRDAEIARRADPRNVNKFSAEYLGKQLSSAAGNVSSFISRHSEKVMPVVDFILGTDDEDDDDDDDSMQNSSNNRTTTRGDDTCAVRVDDETQAGQQSGANNGPLSMPGRDYSAQSKFINQHLVAVVNQSYTGQNINNCADTNEDLCAGTAGIGGSYREARYRVAMVTEEEDDGGARGFMMDPRPGRAARMMTPKEEDEEGDYGDKSDEDIFIDVVH